MKRPVVFIVACTAFVLAAGSAHAICTPDHLSCYKIKDTTGTQGVQTKDLTEFLQGQTISVTGCQVQTPPKTACLPTCKSPTGPPSGQGQAVPLLCYKVKCPKSPPPTVSLGDQFGMHTITFGTASKLLCAPTCAGPGAPCSSGADCCTGNCDMNNICA